MEKKDSKAPARFRRFRATSLWDAKDKGNLKGTPWKGAPCLKKLGRLREPQGGFGRSRESLFLGPPFLGSP